MLRTAGAYVFGLHKDSGLGEAASVLSHIEQGDTAIHNTVFDDIAQFGEAVRWLDIKTPSSTTLQYDEIRIGDYVVKVTADPQAMTIRNWSDGSNAVVDLDIGTLLFGAQRAWSILERFFDQAHVDQLATAWVDSVDAALEVAEGTAALQALGNMGGLVLGAYINPAGVAVAATSAFASYAAGTTKDAAILMMGAAGVHDAAQALMAAKSTFLGLKQSVTNGETLSVDVLKAAIDQAICAIHIGNTFNRAVVHFAGVSDTFGDDIAALGESFLGPIEDSLSPLANLALDFANTLNETSTSLQILAWLVATANGSFVRFQPLTDTGLIRTESLLEGSPFIDPDSDGVGQNHDTGPAFNLGATVLTEGESIGDTTNNVFVDFVGASVSSTVSAGAGDDWIMSGGGFDFIVGGAGSDTVNIDYSWINYDVTTQFYTTYSATRYTGNFSDAVHTFEARSPGNFNFAEVATIGIENFQLRTGSGNDRLRTGSGNDVVDSGAGDDEINTGEGHDVIIAGSGNDTIDSGFGVDRIIGGAGFDVLTLDRSYLTIDFNYSFAAASSSQGQQLADGSFVSGIEAATLFSGSGNDTISTGIGEPFYGIIVSGSGNDTIFVGGKSDLVVGGAGSDTVNIDYSWITYDVTTQFYTTYSATRYTGNFSDAVHTFEARSPGNFNFAEVATIGIENFQLRTGSGNDRLRTGSGNDVVDSGAGDDEINTGEGDDTIFAGSGDDIIDGGDGMSRSYGGIGRDRLILGANAAGSIIDGGADTDTLVINQTVGSLAGLAGIEALEFAGGAALTVTGTQFKTGLASNTSVSGSGTLTVNMDVAGQFISKLFSFAGSGVSLVVNGTSGNDIFKLGNAVHTVNAGDGVDQIKGGNAADTLNGGNGVDKINGVGGADILTGGAGNDVFKYGAATDSGLGAASDRITDFVIGGDRLNFTQIDANAGLGGDQAFAFVGTGAFTGGGAGSIRYQNSGADLLVQIDADGNGTADMEIILQGLNGQTLTAGDFVL